jgi:hypothetical protein
VASLSSEDDVNIPGGTTDVRRVAVMEFEPELHTVASHVLPRLEQAWRDDEVGSISCRVGYVQWEKAPGGLQIECVSNHFLDSDEQLGFEQRRELAKEQWHAPDNDCPNYYKRIEYEQDLCFAAADLAHAAEFVLGGTDPEITTPGAATHNIADLLEAILEERFTRSWSDDQYVRWSQQRAEAMVAAFERKASTELSFISGVGSGSVRHLGLDHLFDSAARSWLAIRNPFHGYLEVPEAIVQLHAVCGDRLEEALEAARQELMLLMMRILHAEGLSVDTTVTDDDLRRAGWHPVAMSRPGPYDDMFE